VQKETDKLPVTHENFNMQDQSKIKQTIFDFFQIELKRIPDESFIETEVVINKAGNPVQCFKKSLNYKECGIFDTIQVNVFRDKNKNVILKSVQPEMVNMDNLKNLIDDLYLIYGEDNNCKGKFTNKDMEDFNYSNAYSLFGRSWHEFPKYEYPIRVSRYEDEISITIMGIGNE
jgi:hypothetical protein